MDAKYKFSIEGTRFGIETHLINKNNAGWEFDKSILSRFFIAKEHVENYLTIQEGLTQINSRLPFNIQVIFINNGKICLASAKKITHSTFEFEKYYDNQDLNKKRLSDLVCANNLFDAEINSRVFQKITENILHDINNFSGLTIFSGELIWSGWADYFVILSFLLTNEINTGNYAVDSFGILEFALNNIKNKVEINNFHKSLFYPNITVINNTRKHQILPLEKIKISKGRVEKYIHNVASPFNYFDLKEADYEFNNTGYHLSRHLLIKNREKITINRNKRQALFNSTSKIIQRYIYPHKLTASSMKGKLLLDYYNIKFQPVDLLTNRDVKDMTINGEKSYYRYFEMPSESAFQLVDGQIIVKGDFLYSYKSRGKVVKVMSDVDGEVSKSLIDSDILEIMIDKKNVSIQKEIPGKIVGLDKAGTVVLETELLEAPVSYNSNKVLGGEIKEWSPKKLAEFNNFNHKIILYIRNNNDISFDNLIFKIGIISAVLVSKHNLLNDKSLKLLDAARIPVIYLDSYSNNANPDIEKLLSICIDKYIQIAFNKIEIPYSFVSEYLKYYRQSINSNLIRKGVSVKFENYQSNYLYGKIEKSLKDSSENCLVNMPDGIFEAHPANIIIA